MVNMAQRIGELRTERNMTRPALSAALGFPKTAIEKFETGRQTPSQEQQAKLASYFGVSPFYLRGESCDRLSQDDWMDEAFSEEPAPEVSKRQTTPPKALSSASSGTLQGGMFDSFFASPKFQESLRGVVLDVLRSPEGQEILSRVIRRELAAGK